MSRIKKAVEEEKAMQNWNLGASLYYHRRRRRLPVERQRLNIEVKLLSPEKSNGGGKRRLDRDNGQTDLAVCGHLFGQAWLHENLNIEQQKLCGRPSMSGRYIAELYAERREVLPIHCPAAGVAGLTPMKCKMGSTQETLSAIFGVI